MRPELALLIAAHRFGWRAAGGRRVSIALVAVALAVVVEAMTRFLDWPPAAEVGRVPVPASVVPLAVAAIAGGRRCLGRPLTTDRARVFWALAVVGLSAGAWSLAEGRDPGLVGAMMLIGFVEEFMYRGAIPALAAFALVRTGLSPQQAGLAGMAFGGACFVLLPGHVAQFDDAGVVPFVAFAALAAIAVWRTGALLEIALLHAVVNLVNIGRFDGVNDPAAAALLAALMAVFVLAYVPVGVREDVVIDLTGDEPTIARRRARPARPSVVRAT